jgi:hydroxypyruvate reductase
MVKPNASAEALALLRSLFDTAIAAAQPELCVPPFLPTRAELGSGRLIVIGAGKASAAMARALEDHYKNNDPELLQRLEGLVITRYGYGVNCSHIEIVEAAHPVPDAAGLAAAQRMLERVQGLHEADLVIGLISGGGSALLPLPARGLTLADKQQINRSLLESGATIVEMNCVRRHLSAIKGGRLGAACYPARVLNLLMSDVPGDQAIDIASGPTVADPSTREDALAIIARYHLRLPDVARHWLEDDASESIKPDDPRMLRVQTRIIAAPQQSLEAAAALARRAGYGAHILGDAIEGEARDVGKVLARITTQIASRGQPFDAPCVLLSGGETTVTLRDASGSDGRDGRDGRGGRNVEFLLAFGIALGAQAGVHALAGDTDGVDGVEEIAGAYWQPDTLTRAQAAGLRPTISLDQHDAHGFFQALGQSIITGPTRTNVNDFRAILIQAGASIGT